MVTTTGVDTVFDDVGTWVDTVLDDGGTWVVTRQNISRNITRKARIFSYVSSDVADVAHHARHARWGQKVGQKVT